MVPHEYKYKKIKWEVIKDSNRGMPFLNSVFDGNLIFDRRARASKLYTALFIQMPLLLERLVIWRLLSHVARKNLRKIRFVKKIRPRIMHGCTQALYRL